MSQGFGGPRSLSSFSCTCICITNHFFSLTDTAASASAILLQQLAADPSCHPTRMRPQPHAPTHTSLVTRCTAAPPPTPQVDEFARHAESTEPGVVSPLGTNVGWLHFSPPCQNLSQAKKQKQRVLTGETLMYAGGYQALLGWGGGQGVWEGGGASRRHACKCIGGGGGVAQQHLGIMHPLCTIGRLPKQ